MHLYAASINCTNMIIPGTSQHNLLKTMEQDDIIYITLGSNGTQNYTQDKVNMMPQMWAWAYRGKEGYYPLLESPFDYVPLSLNTLQYYVRYISVDVIFEPHGCKVNLNDVNTEKLISRRLYEVAKNVTKSHRHYEPTESSFCHAVAKTNTISGALYWYMHHSGNHYSQNYLNYRCCHTSIFNEEFACSETKICWSALPLVLAEILKFLIFIYSPLLFCYCLKDENQGRYQDNATDNSENTKKCELLCHNPVGMMYLVHRSCNFDLGKRCKVRFQLLLAMLVLYIIQIIRVTIWHIYYYDDIRARFDFGVPMGFLSVPFIATEFWKTFANFGYCFGGPLAFILGFPAICVILIFVSIDCGSCWCKCCKNENIRLPVHADNDIEHPPTTSYTNGNSNSTDESGESLSASSEDNFCKRLQNFLMKTLNMSDNKIEKFGAKNYTHSRGFGRLYNYLIARLNLLWNIRFWKHCWSCCKTECVCCQCLCACLFPIVFIVITLWYGTPMLYMFYAACKSSFNRLPCVSNKFCKVICGIITFAFLFYGFVLFCVIFTSSAQLLLQIVGFTFVGLTLYPWESSGKVVIAVIAIAYLLRVYHDFRIAYEELFQITLDICQKLQRKRVQLFRLQGDTITLDVSDLAPVIKTIVINGEKADIQHPPSQINTPDGINVTPTQNQDDSAITDLESSYNSSHGTSLLLAPQENNFIYVQYMDNQPAIEEGLFQCVVDTFKPYHVSVFHAFVKLFLITLYVITSVSFVFTFNIAGTHLESRSTLELLVLIFTGLLPEYVLSIYATSRAARKQQQKAKVRKLVQDYAVKKMQELQHNNIEDRT